MALRRLMLVVSVVALFPISVRAQERHEDPSDPNCHVKVDTEQGKGGMQAEICKDHAGVSVGGPIKDVTLEHPLGGKDAALPKAGRDIDKAKNDVGHAVEHAGQWVGKRLGIKW